MIMRKLSAYSAIAALSVFTTAAPAHDIDSPPDPSKPAAFDITRARATTDGRLTTFLMEVAGAAGSRLPESIGQIEGATVDAYVWPTDLDPSVVGFDPGSGILALAITAHPDFDDTPLFDENSNYPPAKPGALVCEPLKAAWTEPLKRFLEPPKGGLHYISFNWSIR